MKRSKRAKNSDKVLSFDLGGTKLGAGLFEVVSIVNQKQVAAPVKLLTHEQIQVDWSQGTQGVLAQFHELGRLVCEKAGASMADVASVGLASAGPINTLKGTILNPINFAGGAIASHAVNSQFRQWAIVKDLVKLFKKEVAFENDAACAALGEQAQGVAKGCDDFLLLTLGTGLGTAIVNQGRLVSARSGLHTEAGHFVLSLSDTAPLCNCGTRGCAEAYLCSKGYAAVGEAEYVRRLTQFIRSFAVVFAPKQIVIGGGFGSKVFLEIESKLKLGVAEALSGWKESGVSLPKIVAAKLKNEAGLVGAAVLASRGL